ncbi:MAG: leucyl aminopeptidase [Candidatus Omnitrophica bacterium]|nr:leucyl aminopeptidase [Candidatus Omnitrophota bacterium]
MITFQAKTQGHQTATLILLYKDTTGKAQHPLIPKDVTEPIKDLAEKKQFDGDKGVLFPLMINDQLYLLVGLGKQKDATPTSIRIVVRQACLSAYLKNTPSAEIIPADHETETIIAVIEGILLGTYTWDKYITPPKENAPIKDKDYVIITKKKKTYEDSIVICAGTNFTRDLVNDNADTVHSEFLEKTVRDVIKGHKNTKLTVFGRKELKARGMNLHLAVNQGSRYEPKLIIVEYNGDKPNNKYSAIVGKGITYDTGGLNLKPSGYMETMRMDMGGTASVIGTMQNILALAPKKNILFACGIAENAIGPGAYKPGDIIKSFSGKTVEVANTDAEGRLVLADALSYLTETYKIKRVIDIATLTGACVVALGHDYTGLMSSQDDFAQKMLTSAQATDDRAWQLPIYPELKNAVKSKIADIRNLGFAKGAAGTITAGEFLRQFTNDVPWAHLDIAGSAWVDGADRMYFGHGATGASVRLLTHFLRNH